MSPSDGKQALMDHYRELVNRRSAGHKPTSEQEYDALDQLLTDVGGILDDLPVTVWRLRQRTAGVVSGSSARRGPMEVLK
jgi:hypothetical protein